MAASSELLAVEVETLILGGQSLRRPPLLEKSFMPDLLGQLVSDKYKGEADDTLEHTHSCRQTVVALPQAEPKSVCFKNIAR